MNKEETKFINKIKRRIQLIFETLSIGNEELSLLPKEGEGLFGSELDSLLWQGYVAESERALNNIPSEAIITFFKAPVFEEIELFVPFSDYLKSCRSFFLMDLERTVQYIEENRYDKRRDILFEHLGLSPFIWEGVERFRSHLENLNGYALTYKLGNPYYTQEIVEAIQEGKRFTQKEISRIVSVYAEKKKDDRFQAMAETIGLTIFAIADYITILYGFEKGYLSKDLRRFWVHMDDPRVRAAHYEIPVLNSEGIPPDGIYQTPLGPLRFPRDPNGSLDNILRCRCHETYTVIKKPFIWYKWRPFHEAEK